MKNISVSLLLTLVLIAGFLLPRHTIASTQASDSKDQIITMLLEKIKILEEEIKVLKNDLKSYKIDISNSNSDYTKKVNPLYDSLDKKAAAREKLSIRLSESTCVSPFRATSGGKTTFSCKDNGFKLDKNIDVESIVDPTTKQKALISEIKKLDSNIEEINSKIDGHKKRYGIQ